MIVDRLIGKPPPRSIVYGKRMRPADRSYDPDVDDLGVEDLLDLVADEVVHRLHVELGGEPCLDAVDDRQLGGALVGLGQQPLRLVEEPRVLEGHAQAARRAWSAGGRRSLKAYSRSRFWSEMTPVDLAADDQRGEQDGLRRLALMDERLAHLRRPLSMPRR